MCDKVHEGDDKFQEVRNIVGKTGCLEVQDKLDECLRITKKDWRKCQAEVGELAKCVRSTQPSK